MQGIASVKLVLSADTVILRGKPVSGPPPERLLSFSNISSPRIGSLKEEEEPFAFKAREFLRNLIIANQVMFKLEYKSISNRDYGFLLLNPANAIDGETNVTRILVKYGWAKVKIDGSRELSEEQNILTMLELEAQAAGRGIWSIIPDIVFFIYIASYCPLHFGWQSQRLPRQVQGRYSNECYR